MLTLEKKQIEQSLKDIETGIKGNKKITRKDVQDMFDRIKGYGYSPETKKEIIRDLIIRTGIKLIKPKILTEPRRDTDIFEDATKNFLNDIYSYRGVIEDGKSD